MADNVGIKIDVKVKDAIKDIKRLERNIVSVTTKFEKQGNKVTSLENKLKKHTKRTVDHSNKRVRAIEREIKYNKKLKALEGSGFDVKQGYVKGSFKRALKSGSPEGLKDAKALRDMRYDELMQMRRKLGSQLKSGTADFKKQKAKALQPSTTSKDKRRASFTEDAKITIDEIRMSNKKLIRSSLMAKDAQKNLMKSTRKLNKSFMAGEITSRKYRSEIRKLQKTAKKTTFKGTIREVRNLTRAYKYHIGTLIGIGGLVAAVSLVGGKFEQIRGTLMAASGSLEQADKDFEFVSETAKSLGLNLSFAADGFSKLAVASKDKVGSDQIKDFFTAFASYSKAVGQSQFRFDKSLQAVSQMFSKGTVMSEELRQQLGEAMPRALQIFASSLDMTTQELFEAMEKGQIKLEDHIDAITTGFAKAALEGGSLQMMIDGFTSSLERARSYILLFGKDLFDSGIGVFSTGLLNTFSQILNLLSPLASVVGALFKPIGLVLNTIAWVMENIRVFVKETFPQFGSVVTTLAESLGFALGTALTLNAALNFGSLISGLKVFTGLMRTLAGIMKTQAVFAAITAALTNPASLGIVAGIGAAAGIGYLAYSASSGSRGGGGGGASGRNTSSFSNTRSQSHITVKPTIIVDGFEPHIRKISTEVVNSSQEDMISHINDGA